MGPICLRYAGENTALSSPGVSISTIDRFHCTCTLGGKVVMQNVTTIRTDQTLLSFTPSPVTHIALCFTADNSLKIAFGVVVTTLGLLVLLECCCLFCCRQWFNNHCARAKRRKDEDEPLVDQQPSDNHENPQTEQNA